MLLDEAVLEGTLKADGTLELDKPPQLPAGRVTVVLRSQTIAPAQHEDLWQFMQRSRRELEQSGAKFMNEQEVQAHIEWLREGDAIDDWLQRQDS
ncbi:MAG TPA: hypothetical protein PLN21_08285 [Gemmatales bacterium]|nr:hypothetical protein [Gemmatales bacterium]